MRIVNPARTSRFRRALATAAVVVASVAGSPHTSIAQVAVPAIPNEHRHGIELSVTSPIKDRTRSGEAFALGARLTFGPDSGAWRLDGRGGYTFKARVGEVNDQRLSSLNAAVDFIGFLQRNRARAGGPYVVVGPSYTMYMRDRRSRVVGAVGLDVGFGVWLATRSAGQWRIEAVAAHTRAASSKDFSVREAARAGLRVVLMHD